MIVVAHNLAAMNAGRQFNITGKKKAKNVEKLSSGYKVNRAADDAAGLSISEKMRNQIRGLHQAMNNIEDGVNFCQVADGALNEVHSILGRIGELAVQAANDVNEEDDRKAIDDEVQQLKAEMKKIFRTTEFNGKRYWVEPYVPEVEGIPDDVMIYNSDSDEHNGYGGMLINGIRYSWDDLGVTFDSNGYFTSDDSGEGFTDYKGEQIAWETSPTYVDENENVIVERDMPPNIRRTYTWTADDTGIYVNNVFAISKEELLGKPLGQTSQGFFYGFEYHGMTVEFLVPNGDKDDWDAICDGINGRVKGGFDSVATWESVAMTPSETIKDSVTFNGGYTKTQQIYISDAWKDNVADRSNYYSLDTMAVDADGDGHGDGIRLVDNGRQVTVSTDDNKHTNTKWEDMSDSSITGAYTNGGYPIVDWGTDYDAAHQKPGCDENDITLNESATYTYTDAVTGFNFTYNLTDEVSLENMEKELREAGLYTSINAPVATSIAKSTTNVKDSNGNSVRAGYLSSGGTDMTFALQRDSGKSFGDGTSVSSANFNMHYNVSSFSSDQDILNAAMITLQYNLHTSGGSEQLLSTEASISGSKLWDLVRDGGDYTFSFSNSRLMDGLSSAEAKDKSVTYGMNYTMSLHVDKVYFEPQYEVVINREYSNAQKTAESDGDIKRLIDSLCRTEHADWFEQNENGTLSDTIAAVHTADRNNYSTIGIAEKLQGILADADGNYSFTYNGHSFKLSQDERDLLVGWRETAENKYADEMGIYKTNLDNQYIAVYNMLKNAGLTTKQTEHPSQIITMKEIATKSRHTLFDVRVRDAEKHMYIQTGANSGEHQEIRWKNLSLSLIGMNGVRTTSRESATNTITKVQSAVRIISRERSKFGAQQVRLERAYDNNANYSENLQNAESNIRDTDMAKEAMELSKLSILEQVGQTMLAQANQKNQAALKLLQS